MASMEAITSMHSCIDLFRVTIGSDLKSILNDRQNIANGKCCGIFRDCCNRVNDLTRNIGRN